MTATTHVVYNYHVQCCPLTHLIHNTTYGQLTIVTFSREIKVQTHLNMFLAFNTLESTQTTATNLHVITNYVKCTNHKKDFFYVLLTVHLSTNLANDQLDAPLLYFITRLLQYSTCFEHHRAHHQEVKLCQYSICYGHSL